MNIYLLVFIGMAIESTFIPLPSEIVMIPAGIAASIGGNELNFHHFGLNFSINLQKCNIILIILAGTLGSIAGALINYSIGYHFGRKAITFINGYFYKKMNILSITEKFFLKHGNATTFFGRLIPVVRHIVSIPAGISKMNLVSFIFYTGLGSVIWVTFLAFLGYFLGENYELLLKNIKITILAILLVIISFILLKIYIIRKWKKEF